MSDHNRTYNIGAARELILRYREFTEEQAATFGNSNVWPLEAVQAVFYPVKCLRSLFDFGTRGCILCESAEKLSDEDADIKCEHCVHSFTVPEIKDRDELNCVSGYAQPTYSAMVNANSPQALVKAVHDRADYLERLLETWSITCNTMTR